MTEILKKLLLLAKRLLGVPVLNDEPAVRAFATKYLILVEAVAERTPGELDDKFVDFCQASVANDPTWAALYALLLEGLADRQVFVVGASASARHQFVLAAEKAGLDIETVLKWLQKLLDALLLIWR